MMSARWRDLGGLAAVVVGTYAMVFLMETPRGDWICARVDRFLFPPWLTGEAPAGRLPEGRRPDRQSGGAA